jgi:hypothetical protein
LGKNRTFPGKDIASQGRNNLLLSYCKQKQTKKPQAQITEPAPRKKKRQTSKKQRKREKQKKEENRERTDHPIRWRKAGVTRWIKIPENGSKS